MFTSTTDDESHFSGFPSKSCGEVAKKVELKRQRTGRDGNSLDDFHGFSRKYSIGHKLKCFECGDSFV